MGVGERESGRRDRERRERRERTAACERERERPTNNYFYFIPPAPPPQFIIFEKPAKHHLFATREKGEREYQSEVCVAGVEEKKRKKTR